MGSLTSCVPNCFINEIGEQFLYLPKDNDAYIRKFDTHQQYPWNNETKGLEKRTIPGSEYCNCKTKKYGQVGKVI